MLWLYHINQSSLPNLWKRGNIIHFSIFLFLNGFIINLGSLFWRSCCHREESESILSMYLIVSRCFNCSRFTPVFILPHVLSLFLHWAMSFCLLPVGTHSSFHLLQLIKSTGIHLVRSIPLETLFVNNKSHLKPNFLLIQPVIFGSLKYLRLP